MIYRSSSLQCLRPLSVLRLMSWHGDTWLGIIQLFFSGRGKENYTWVTKPLHNRKTKQNISLTWPHSLDEQDAFSAHLRESTDRIGFTSEIFKTEINFLDIKIRLQKRKLETDLYTKHTN